MDFKRNKQNPQKPTPDGEKPRTNGWAALTIAILVVLAVSTIFRTVSDSQYTKTTWTDFRSEMAAGNLSEVEIEYDRVVYMTKEEAEKPAKEQKACFTGLPSSANIR